MAIQSYVTLSRQAALRKQHQIIANNTANISTTGFKRQDLFLIGDETPQPNKASLVMPHDYSSYRNLEQGPADFTGNDLDMMLSGKGYFAVTREGQTYYSRDGKFTLNENSELVTLQGDLVQSKDGGPISIPGEATEIKVHPNGNIETDMGNVGALKVVTFANEQELKELGNNLYEKAQNQAEIDPEPGEFLVKQKYVEGSNVNAAIELTRGMEIMREFQMNQRMLDEENERISNLIQYI